MTLYSKEEIVGRNCRFLQGKYTDKEMVRNIRKAVDTGNELDVEILNYRKDGVPFWNNFLMLPVHKHPKAKKKGETNPVTHFIAIQKDVTVLKQGTHPELWKPVEVAFYFDYLGLGQYGDSIVSNSITGDVFLSLEVDDLHALQITNKEHVDLILKKIEILKKDPTAAYKELSYDRVAAEAEEAEADDEASSNGDESQSSQTGATPRITLSSSELYVAPPPDCTVNLEQPKHLRYWVQKEEYEATTCFKSYCGDEINIFLTKSSISYKRLLKKLKSLYWADVKIKFKDIDGDFVSIIDEASLKLAKDQHRGRTLPIYVTKGDAIFPSTKKKSIESSTIVLIVSGDSRIIHPNTTAMKFLGAQSKSELIGKDFGAYVNGVGDIATWKGKGTVTGTKIDGSSFTATLSTIQRPNRVVQVNLRLPAAVQAV